MDTAPRVLVGGGMAVLSVGLLLGIAMAVERNRAPRAPRYLVTAHLAALIQGALLLALTVAVEVSSLAAGAETAAAFLLLGGVVLFEVGNVVNWLRGVHDSFAEKAVGGTVSAAGAPFMLVGAGILVYGVAAGL